MLVSARQFLKSRSRGLLHGIPQLKHSGARVRAEPKQQKDVASAVLSSSELSGRAEQCLALVGVQELEEASTAMGYGAVKYADLKNQRMTNYKFSFDEMLKLQGNTAVYLLYAHARIAGIIRKADVDIAGAPYAHSLPGLCCLSIGIAIAVSDEHGHEWEHEHRV